MKRWLLQLTNAAGVVVHEERFWLWSNAEKIGRFYSEPLPSFVAWEQVGPRKRVRGLILTADIIDRWRRQ